MYPPLYAICAADTGVKTLFADPPRVYPAGDSRAGNTKPYAVYQVIGGFPENFLGAVPNTDVFSVQIDVYGDTVESVTDGAEAIRDAIEPSAYVTRWGGVTRDPDTHNCRYSFDAEFITAR